jgi:hypothetical protein
MKLYSVRVYEWEENFTIGIFSTEELAREFAETTPWRQGYALKIELFELDKKYPYLYGQKAIDAEAGRDIDYYPQLN